MSAYRLVQGKTVEGGAFELRCRYKTEDPDDDLAEFISGEYIASDGRGQVFIERGDDGLFYAEGDKEGSKTAEALLPWVITQGHVLKISAVPS